MSERYEIGTIEQMAAIPEEALPRFLAELPEILAAVAFAEAFNASVNTALGEGTVARKAPVWIDDGKRDATYRGIDKATGEEMFSVNLRTPNTKGKTNG